VAQIDVKFELLLLVQERTCRPKSWISAKSQVRTLAATTIDKPKLQAGLPLPAFRRDLFARANGTPSALAGGGRDCQEKAAHEADQLATIEGINDLRRTRPDIGRGLDTLADLGKVFPRHA
jgi:hypothetical protein